MNRNRAVSVVCFLLALAASRSCAAQQIWRLDRTDRIGHLRTTVLGHPQIVQSPYGKAVRFDGRQDALFVTKHPLAGAATWSCEVTFEPDDDGAAQQRFFHLSVLDSAGHDTSDRMLFEIRIVKNAWCLDSFALSGEHKTTLLNCEKRYPWANGTG